MNKSLLVWISLCVSCSHQISNNDLLMAVNTMKTINPTGNFNLMCQTSQKQAKIVLNLLENIKTVGFGQIFTHQQSAIYCADNHPMTFFKILFHEIRSVVVLDTWIIVGSTSALNVISDELGLQLHERVYFFNTEEKIIFEMYRIKTILVNKTIAIFDMEKGSLVWQDEKDFVTRRANYHNVQIDAGFFNNPPYANLDQETMLKIEKNNNTDIVISLKEPSKVEGFNFDVLNVLKEDLNSSLSVYWYIRVGFSPPIRVNGTVKWTGVTGLLISQVIDIIVSSTPHTLGQSKIKSFAHAFGDLKTALYVNVNAGSNEKDWLTFVTPFRSRLWALFVTNGILITVGLNIIFFIKTTKSYSWYSYSSLLAFFGDIWTILMSYFSRPANGNIWWILPSTKIWLLFVFLSGNLTWMLYRGSINAELSARKYFMPFTSPQELYDSDFQ